MIGRKEWFTRRKYSGWGLTPKTWQGFVYIGIIIAIGYLVSLFPVPSGLKMTLTIGLVMVVIADILHIMASIKVDERDAKIEALSERNASWAMVGSLAILIIYFSMVGSSMTVKDLTPFLIFPMITGLVAKAVSAFLLQKKEL